MSGCDREKAGTAIALDHMSTDMLFNFIYQVPKGLEFSVCDAILVCVQRWYKEKQKIEQIDPVSNHIGVHKLYTKKTEDEIQSNTSRGRKTYARPTS